MSIQYAGVGAAGNWAREPLIMAAETKMGISSAECSIITKIKSPLYLKMKEAVRRPEDYFKKLQNIAK